MTLIKHNRSKRLPSLFESLIDDSVFDIFPDFIGTNHMNRGFPAINQKETDKSYEIELAAPGLSKEDFNVSLEDGLLTISSEKKSDKSESDEGYTFRGFNYSSFSRSFTLPENADGENISAKYENGILKLELPKMKIAEKSPKMIDVL